MASKSTQETVILRHSARTRRFGAPLSACLSGRPSGRLSAYWLAAILAIALALSPINNAYAQGSDTQRRAAIAEAISQAGGYGKVISVKPHASSDNKPGFRVRILTDGRVRTFDIPVRRN